MLKKDIINLDLKAGSKLEVIDQMVNMLASKGRLKDKELFKEAVLQREKQSSTGLEEGLAIPHAKTKAVRIPSIAFARVREGVDYGAMDDEKSYLFFMIAAPENATDSHIETLTKLTSYFLDDDFREALLEASSSEEIINLIDKKESEDSDFANDLDITKKFVLAVTACPVGIAHTYMAADSLKAKAKEMGIGIKVETNGSVGIKDMLTKEEIEKADGIIIAADKTVEMSRFDGKQIIQVPVKNAIKEPEVLINKILDGKGETYSSFGAHKEKMNEHKKDKKGIYKHLMNGVSHMLPLVVVGGVLIALSIALSGIKAGSGADVTNPLLVKMLNLGVEAFGLMVPVLAGYIAYSIADRPGLAPGLIGGALSNTIGAGFLGGLIAGFMAGYTAKWVKSWNVPQQLAPIMPIFIIPLVSSLVVGLGMGLIGLPIKSIMDGMTNGLKAMEAGSVVLAVILGLMIAFDMGGPVNKVAFLFGAAMIQQGVPQVMGPIAVAICIPPISMGLATLLSPKKYSEGERESGKAALAMGMIGITEGAIPFAAADPLRVIPSIMTGSAVGAAIAAFGKVTDHAPHGGPIVLPVVDNKLFFVVAILVGVMVSALMVNMLKKEEVRA
jgi:PTS system fructose-specific IIC component